MIRVATINILNFEHEWQRRLELLRSARRLLRPDVLAMQEVVYPMDQEYSIGGSRRDTYEVARGWDEAPELGNSILVRRSLSVLSSARRDLRQGCSALRVDLRTSDGRPLSVTTTHLYWPEKARQKRARQGDRLLRLVDAAPSADRAIVTGDFNADPSEPVYRYLEHAGFRSAHRLATGIEPEVTYPTPLLRGRERPARQRCVDYIWIRGDLIVVAAGLAFDEPEPGDPHLYPSDHFGLFADLELA